MRRQATLVYAKVQLIALVKKAETIQALLKALHLPTQATGPPEKAKPDAGRD